MRLHHVGGYSKEERDGYREIVYANLVRPEATRSFRARSFQHKGFAPDMRSIACCSQIQSMQVVIEALHDLNMPLPPSLQEMAALIMSTRVSAHDPCPPMLDPAVTNALVALWADPTTKACVSKSREFQLNDSAS